MGADNSLLPIRRTFSIFSSKKVGSCQLDGMNPLCVRVFRASLRQMNGLWQMYGLWQTSHGLWQTSHGLWQRSHGLRRRVRTGQEFGGGRNGCLRILLIVCFVNFFYMIDDLRFGEHSNNFL